MCKSDLQEKKNADGAEVQLLRRVNGLHRNPTRAAVENRSWVIIRYRREFAAKDAR